MSSTKNKKFAILIICSLSLCSLYCASSTITSLKKDIKFLTDENRKLSKQVSELNNKRYNPYEHIRPKNEQVLYIDSKEKAFQAYVNASALKYGKVINVNDLIVYHNEERYIGYTDQTRETSYIVFNNTTDTDNEDYYTILVKISEQTQNGGSGTAANISVYKDGYITGI